MTALHSYPADSVRVVLHVDDDSTDADYVNTEEGADYINASYVNVCMSMSSVTKCYISLSVCRATTSVIYSL